VVASVWNDFRAAAAAQFYSIQLPSHATSSWYQHAQNWPKEDNLILARAGQARLQKRADKSIVTTVASVWTVCSAAAAAQNMEEIAITRHQQQHTLSHTVCHQLCATWFLHTYSDQ
jgi:hypothetical protein